MHEMGKPFLDRGRDVYFCIVFSKLLGLLEEHLRLLDVAKHTL